MRTADADILIVPGLHDSDADHWQSRWQQKLSTARRVVQQDWSNPQRDAWAAAVERAVEESERPVIVVAHSLGVIAVLHAAQRVGDKIAGAFLVAPPSETVLREFPGVDKSFLPIPRRHLAFPALLVSATDDPYSDQPFAKVLAADIGAQFVDAGQAGHINVESGHGPWPEGSMAFAHFISKL
jgi:predicted alpha/beta hydrolase family esterase